MGVVVAAPDPNPAPEVKVNAERGDFTVDPCSGITLSGQQTSNTGGRAEWKWGWDVREDGGWVDWRSPERANEVTVALNETRINRMNEVLLEASRTNAPKLTFEFDEMPEGYRFALQLVVTSR